MCESIFKNQEEKKRRDEFTKLFAILVSSNTNVIKQTGASEKRKEVQAIGG